ncbi:MAG TPA: AAA family ATPase [Spirochaetota bacterium]|nr:AAA family ATPase [Spirochaetota bacterium]
MNFSGIKGHEKQRAFLNRLARSESIPHAILLSGQSGIGKRMIAERFIKSLYCTGTQKPCLECSACRQIAVGSFPDYLVLNRDEKGRIPVGVREKPAEGTVRWLIDKMTRVPVTGRCAVFIDGVHTISDAGQNALLKTIEEPYSEAVIVMLSEGRSGILPTILSRCMDITFNPLADTDVASILASSGVKESSVDLMAAMSGGSMDCAIRLKNEKVMMGVLDFAVSLTSAVKSGSANRLFASEVAGADDDFLLTVLINIYSYTLRERAGIRSSILPAGVVPGIEDAAKIVKILLAIRKGGNNNLNIRNMLKGMLYSYRGIDASLPVSPDFSWL